MKKVYLFVLLFVSNFTFSQLDLSNQEIGVEVFAGGSNLGGSVGGQLKYGFVLQEKFFVGPSFRFHRTWANNMGNKFGFNMYGPGVFGHYRIKDALFLGAEFEFLRSPFNFSNLTQTAPKKWAPALFLGGGFTVKLGEKVKLNAAIFYDVINAPNSPFRSSYNFQIKSQNGQTVRILPMIYRITFMFPLGQR